MSIRHRALVRLGLHLDLEAVSVDVEVIDVVRRKLALQRREDPVDRNPHRLGLGAVEIEEQLRRTRFERAERIGDLRRLFLVVQDSEHPVERLLELLRSLAARHLQHEGHAARRAEPHDRRRLEDVDERGRNAQPGPH